MMRRTVLLVMSLLFGSMGIAQSSDDDEPMVEPEDTVDLEVFSDPTDEQSEAPEAPDEQSAADPLADIEAAEQRRIDATLERFEPTEKISEDRSVAFPNDI